MSNIPVGYDEDIALPPRNWQFEDVFEEYLYAHVESRGSRVIGEYFPSEIGYCGRQIFMKFFKPSKPSISSLKIYFSGNMHQDHFLSPVLSWKYGEHAHIPERSITHSIKDEKNKRLILFKGRIDDHMTFKYGRYIMPIEGKTQAMHLYKKNKPSNIHIAQVHPYLAGTGAEYGFIVYMDRSFNIRKDSDKATKTFPVDFDYDYWEELEVRVKYVDSCLLQTLLPLAEARFVKEMNYQCKPTYCPYSQLCAELGENEVQFDNPQQLIESIKNILESLEDDNYAK